MSACAAPSLAVGGASSSFMIETMTLTASALCFRHSSSIVMSCFRRPPGLPDTPLAQPGFAMVNTQSVTGDSRPGDKSPILPPDNGLNAESVKPARKSPGCDPLLAGNRGQFGQGGVRSMHKLTVTPHLRACQAKSLAAQFPPAASP